MGRRSEICSIGVCCRYCFLGYRTYVSTGQLKGAAFTVYYQGEPVVEFYGGYADEEARVPWQKETLALYASASKVVMAVCIGILVDR